MILALTVGVQVGIQIGKVQQARDHQNYLLKGVRK